jgi:hypothetical protein
MRRMMLMLMGVGLLSMLAGCHCFHAHGVCDCEEFDHCTSRSPWVHGGMAPGGEAMPVGESIPAPGPAKLPDAKKNL